MTAASTADLIQLIDLSLGNEPSGIVNFNYLHTLLHAIVGRLGAVESFAGQLAAASVPGVEGGGGRHVQLMDTQVPGTQQVGGGGDGGTGRIAGARSSSSQVTGPSGNTSSGAQVSETAETGGSSAQIATTGSSTSGGAPSTQGTTTDGGTPSSAQGTDGGDTTQTETTDSGEKETDSGKVTFQSSGSEKDTRSSGSDKDKPQREVSLSSAAPKSASVESRPLQRSESRTPVLSDGQLLYHHKSSVVSAANDLGAMERKIQELENRISALDTLPELLERKSSDADSTPVKDRWTFTNLTMRLTAVEEALEQNCVVVDNILGEVQSLRDSIGGWENSLSQLEDRLSENMKDLAAKDSMGAAAAALLNDIQNKINKLQAEVDSIKKMVDGIDPSSYATSSELQTLSQQHSQALLASESALQRSTEVVSALGERVDVLSDDVNKHSEQISQLQINKLNVEDLAGMMPKEGDSDEAASLFPMVVELKSKVEQIREELANKTTLPPDVLDQFSAMQKAIDKITADMTSLSSQTGSGGDQARLEELGSEVAQLRERLSEMDRMVTALSSAMSSFRSSPEPPAEEEGAKYADLDSMNAMQGVLGQHQQEQERLIGTLAHLSNELEVNKEHVKALYSSLDNLRAVKADKEQIEVEVREKADRTALDGKASREWVDSTFDRLDQKIREARDKLLSQEEALQSAVSRLNEDVETKLDRLELEPLKEYFDKKLARVQTVPALPEKDAALADDAAGFKKPLKFKCISCDKPLGLKIHDAMPALPLISTLPGNRTFRPYTTYELELIRRHQRMGLPVFGPAMDFSQGVRSAGGSHTLTHTRRRVRVAPLSTAYSPIETYTSVPARNNGPEEVDIIGQDGHIYKGRMTARNKLPPLKLQEDFKRGRLSRPATSGYHK